MRALQYSLQWMGRDAAEDTPVSACMPSTARLSPHAYWGYTQFSVAINKWWPAVVELQNIGKLCKEIRIT